MCCRTSQRGKSDSSVGWLGPYGVADMSHRHADTTTVDHIIALRKEILSLEKRIEKQETQIGNAVDFALRMQKENRELRRLLNDSTSSNDSNEEADLTVPRENY